MTEKISQTIAAALFMGVEDRFVSNPARLTTTGTANITFHTVRLLDSCMVTA